MRERATGLLLRRIALVFSIILLIGVGEELLRGQFQSEQEVFARFRLRADIGSKFLTGYVEDLLNAELREGRAELGSEKVSERDFTRLSRVLGFSAAVLLDDRGQLLAVEPPAREKLGRETASKYAHLKAALAGQATVSNVVPSAARALPVVGFAVPFETGYGRRVFSGALAISSSRLGSEYLRNILPFTTGARAYLVDTAGLTIASSLDGPQTASLIQEQDSALYQVIVSANDGHYEKAGTTERFTVAPINGTPWRLVLSAPESALLAPVSGTASLWIPRLIFAILCISLVVVVMFSRKFASLRTMQIAELERVSLTDPLTGLHNRRGLELLGSQLLRMGVREKKIVAVLFLDLNGLKRVNDELGHEAGDGMLLRTADVLRETFRDTDVIARLGGDEYCVVGVVPDSLANGGSFSTRLLEKLAQHNSGLSSAPHLSFSVGLCYADPNSPRTLDDLVREADQLMYEHKKSSRGH